MCRAAACVSSGGSIIENTMNDPFLDAAENLLANDPDVVVSIKKLWTLSSETLANRTPVTLEEFTRAIVHDDRFELISGEWADPVPGAPALSGSNQENSDAVKEGPAGHVKLQRIQITPALLTSIMSRKVDSTLDALMRAWDMRPEGDTETENQLLQILSEVKKLQNDLQTLLAEGSGRTGEIPKGE
jgi:hypothetical protein